MAAAKIRETSDEGLATPEAIAHRIQKLVTAGSRGWKQRVSLLRARLSKNNTSNEPLPMPPAALLASKADVDAGYSRSYVR